MLNRLSHDQNFKSWQDRLPPCVVLRVVVCYHLVAVPFPCLDAPDRPPVARQRDDDRSGFRCLPRPVPPGRDPLVLVTWPGPSAFDLGVIGWERKLSPCLPD